MKIAFCDDDVNSLKEMRGFIEEYSLNSDKYVEYTDFSSPLELIAEIIKGTRFDILFMDVIMPGEDGISIAREIRQYDSNVKLIFITSSPDYAIQSYGVKAFFYQLKPIGKEKIFELLDLALAECKKEEARSIIVKCKNGITRISLDQLMCCEVNRRTLLFYMENGSVLEHNGSMDYLCGQLSRYDNFIRPHRSYLINMDYIETISGKAITMRGNGDIPIPHGKYSDIKNRYLKYAFNRNQILF